MLSTSYMMPVGSDAETILALPCVLPVKVFTKLLHSLLPYCQHLHWLQALAFWNSSRFFDSFFRVDKSRFLKDFLSQLYAYIQPV